MLSRTGLATRGAKRMLRDRCVVQVWTEGATNAYNYAGRPTYVAGDEIACSYQESSASEAAQTILQVPTEDATVWLAPAVVVTNRDRIQITKRSGRAITPITYTVQGNPEQDVVLQRVKLKLLIEKTS
jgi:hypothetical protein